VGEFTVRGKRVVVVGAARSGVAAAELLARRGARVILSDTHATVDGAARLAAAGVALELGGHTRETFASAELVVTSPGVPPELDVLDEPRRRGTEIIGELELASRWIQGRVIAITGTKGKSTTTTLIGRMLDAAGKRALVGGNIGIPLSAQVEASTADTIHIVEASSFQLESTSTFRPWIAVWLNLAADHLDRHPTIEAYAAAKRRIFSNQTAADWALVNADDDQVMRYSEGVQAQRVEFSLEQPGRHGFVIDRDWVVRRTASGIERLLPLSAVELTGRHMLNNVLAATGAATLAGAAPQSMAAALQGFRGLPHVMEPAGRLGDVRFVNDSKATNVEAACRSIESFEGGVVAIVGGRFKGGDLRELRAPLAARGRAVVAIGEAAKLVRDAVAGVVPVIDAASMREAVRRGYAAAAPDGVVLLAPACSSFDWFRDYAERGNVFKSEVDKLIAER
jgi:UDP-N-acetylmuramoylalanine--D-glutamate ligase